MKKCSNVLLNNKFTLSVAKCKFITILLSYAPRLKKTEASDATDSYTYWRHRWMYSGATTSYWTWDWQPVFQLVQILWWLQTVRGGSPLRGVNATTALYHSKLSANHSPNSASNNIKLCEAQVANWSDSFVIMIGREVVVFRKTDVLFTDL